MSRARSLFSLALGSGLWILLAAAAVPAAAQEGDDAVCASCHDQGQKVAKSAHAPLACAACHAKHEEYPHPRNTPKPVCTTCHQAEGKDYGRGVHGRAAQKGNSAAPDCAVCHAGAHEVTGSRTAAFRAALPENCGMCHSEVAAQFQASVHGKVLVQGVPEAPVCTDCHGEHSILPHTNAASPVAAGNIRETCGSCHGDVRLSRKLGLPSDRLMSFDASFHGLASRSGFQTVANCASCHGVHNILPSSDPQSTIHPGQLAATCGRCHTGAGQRFAITQVHSVEGRSEPLAVALVRRFYLLVIPLTLGLMILHNVGDWVRKALRMRRTGAVAAASPPRHRPVRMYPFERLQHALLALSFGVLVWTGFALKYPDQFWAKPLLLWEGTWSLRSLLHRAAATVMMAVTAVHLLTLIFSPKLRHHWKQMLPKTADLREAPRNFAYNLGLRARRPARSAHSYIEKAEYWAVVWGTIIMAASGVMLWANNFVLSLAPNSWLDVATAVHFYEAVLATLAIVVWHFYTVIFDPEVYPMDTAWLTGASVKEHEIPEECEVKAAAVAPGHYDR